MAVPSGSQVNIIGEYRNIENNIRNHFCMYTDCIRKHFPDTNQTFQCVNRSILFSNAIEIDDFVYRWSLIGQVQNSLRKHQLLN